MKNVFKKINYRHFVAIGITLIFLAFAIFYFTNSGTRIIEGFRDFGLSIAYYFEQIFGCDWGITPTINNPTAVPITPIFNLPATWDEFVLHWNTYWQIFFTSENLSAYFAYLGNLLYNISKFLLLFGVPLVLVFVMLIKRYLGKQNNDYNKDSKPLIWHKKFVKNVYLPVKVWCLGFIEFLKENKKYCYLWLFVWAYNFNVITIVVEFLAFYFYIVISFDFSQFYVQLYKLLVDISVPLAFIPLSVWLVLVYWFICRIRRKVGYARLNHCERKNCGFINELPIPSLFAGTMGSRKTTLISDVALSVMVMFKDKAFEKILENDLKFPHFPWINFENTLKQAIKKHKIYNLATARQFVQHLQFCFNAGWLNREWKKSIRRHLKKDYYCDYDDLCFGYRIDLYGYEYDDKLKITYLFETLETYAQLYFIYIIQSSLIISNYSIRTDALIEDLGNFPLWNTDFFKRDCRLIDSYSRHSHIIDFDALRLGKRLIENNPNKDSFDFGVINLTEVGKERKNNLELRELKKNEDITNQKNDGFNDWLKMVRHSATVDMYPFVKVITDEQRPESWGADARDLLKIVHIKKSGDFNLLMACVTITELLYHFVFNKFEKMYYQYRFNRSDNVLFMHLIKSLTAKFKHYYDGIYNTFGCSICELEVENGTQDGSKEEKKYYLMSKKIYSKRFSTDCFSDFFTQKNLKSKIGINDLEEYASEKATFEELSKQNSYFMNDLMHKKQNDED